MRSLQGTTGFVITTIASIAMFASGACDERAEAEYEDRNSEAAHLQEEDGFDALLYGEFEPDDPEYVDDEQPLPDSASSDPIAVIELDDEVLLSFIYLTAEDGTSGIGIVEEVPEGIVSPIRAVGLEGSSPLEVFLAFTDQEADPPAVMQELYAKDLADSQPRGWGRDTLAALPRTALQDVACSNSWFTNWVNDSLPSETWRLDQNGTQGVWSNQCIAHYLDGSGCCVGASRKRYQHQISNVDEWRAYTCIQQNGNHSWWCSGSANGTWDVRVWYMYNTGSGWQTAYVSPAQGSPGQNKTYNWHWSTGTNWSWRHIVSNVLSSGSDYSDLYTGWRK